MSGPRCVFCGETFEGRADARFCSSAHRQAAYRERHARRDELELQELGRIARRAVRSGEIDGLDALGLVVSSPLVREALRSARAA